MATADQWTGWSVGCSGRAERSTRGLF